MMATLNVAWHIPAMIPAWSIAPHDSQTGDEPEEAGEPRPEWFPSPSEENRP